MASIHSTSLRWKQAKGSRRSIWPRVAAPDERRHVVLALDSLYRRWIITRHPIPDRLWSAALNEAPYALALPGATRARLRELTTLFLYQKTFAGAHGLPVTETMRARIALHACIPILRLGLDYYSGWKGVVVYPGDFRVRHRYVDDTGVAHEETLDLCGESLGRGPMVLSWEALADESWRPGHDLVIHECAHKLDMLNGTADGFPPLHADMDPRAWTRAMQRAYELLCETVDGARDTRVDAYAATDPAEFFAVMTETFFTAPEIVHEDFPDVYTQLRAFYRQEPLAAGTSAQP